MIILRIISLIFLLLSAVWLPLPASIGFFVIFCSLYPKFFEGLLMGFVLDVLYFSPPLFLKLGVGFFTIGSLAVILITEKVKSLIQGRNIISNLITAAFGGLAFAIFVFLLA
jgi:hypothetical protein